MVMLDTLCNVFKLKLIEVGFLIEMEICHAVMELDQSNELLV